MRRRLAWTRVLVAGLLFGCADAAAPHLFGPFQPEFAIVPSATPNGHFAAAGGSSILKGFNPVNPHNGDAIIATFFWSGSATITSVFDHETNGRPIGNTYNLVELVSSGGIHMATYVAFNVQNFPDAFDERTQAGDSIVVVHANMSAPVTSGGITITAWSGVQPTLAQGLGAHAQGSGTSATQAMADAGTINVNPGALVYAVSMANQIVGVDPPPPPFEYIAQQSDPGNTIKGDARRLIQGGSAGSAHPTWGWGFNDAAAGTHPGTWLATVLALNEAPASSTGNLTVNASTTGSNLDPDGYTITVDGGSAQAIGINGSVSYTNLTATSHTVAISGVAANCTVSGGTSQTVSVPSGGTATATFTVSCSATTGNLTVNTSTTGSSLDPNGYTITVDGGSAQAIGINASVSYSNLAAGNHTVAISGVASNCSVSGGTSQTVSVPSGGTATATFTVSCSATTGNLTVNTSTTGSSVDPNGYTVTVDGGSAQAIGINASVSYSNLTAGNHTVAISGVASNCSVSGGTSRTVSVPSGGTASTTFTVTCSTPPGNLTVNTSTSGSSLDPNGYTVTVDGGSAQAIGINASVSYANLTAGNHTVAISGVASNCSVSGGTSRTVSVPSGGTATTTFSVSCTTPNQPPVVNAGPDQTALTGLLYSSTQSFSDVNANGPWSYRIDWGDGKVSTGTRTGQGRFTVGHTYVTILPKSFTVRVTVTDAAGASGSDTKVVTVVLL